MLSLKRSRPVIHCCVRAVASSKLLILRRPISICLLGAILLANTPSVYPKGSPERIIVRGGGLARTVEINDREALKRFDPWSGQFIDWSKQSVAGAPPDSQCCYEALNPQTGRQEFFKVVQPPDRDHFYQVFFYMKWKGRRSAYDRGDLKMIYAFRYCPGRNGEPGYIYLPGSREEWNTVNAGTIYREGQDGKWHYASVEWEALMNRIPGISNRPNH